MARRAAVARLDPRIREAVDAAIREGRATIDDLVALIRDHGAEVSRSAVGRYSRNYTESLRRYREAQEVAGRWVEQFRANADGDVGRLLAEMLKTLAFQTMANAEDDMEGLELARLARAVRDLTSVDRLKAEAEKRVREDIRAKAGPALAEAEAAARAGRIPAEAIRRIREEIYGVHE